MEVVKRRLIRVRGSYLAYLPKKLMGNLGVNDVEMYWEDDFVGIKPLLARGAGVVEARGALAVYLIVAGYAAGLDYLDLTADRSDVERGLSKVFGRALDRGGAYRVEYEDRYTDKEEVIKRMLDSLLFLLNGLSAGTATAKTVEAVDDEVDKLRLTVNRLCTRYPTPKCGFHIQLARFYERAVDHIVELYREAPDGKIWAILRDVAAGLKDALGDLEALGEYVARMPSARFMAMQLSKGEAQAVHAVRVIDYLHNAAEVYFDIHLYESSCRSQNSRRARA